MHMLTEIGVLREFETDQLRAPDKRWIRHVGFFDHAQDHFFIICCSYSQAKAFSTIRGIEMDLSFKNVQGAANIFSIVGWNEDVQSKYISAYTQ
jgi:small ligand-binding sensory domain FIST